MKLWIATHREDAELFDLVYAATASRAKQIVCDYGLFCEVPTDLVVLAEMTAEEMVQNSENQPLAEPDELVEGKTVADYVAEIMAREAEERRIAEFNARQIVLPGVGP